MQTKTNYSCFCGLCSGQFILVVTSKLTRQSGMFTLCKLSFQINSRSSRLEMFCKKVLLKISQNSQENTFI